MRPMRPWVNDRAEKIASGTAAVIVVHPRRGGPGLKYTVPLSVLPKLGEMNKTLDPRGRYDAVTEGLFEVEPVP